MILRFWTIPFARPSALCGNLDQADISVLLLDPGFGYTDYYGGIVKTTFGSGLLKICIKTVAMQNFHFSG
jgi:hypothetical protein